MSSSYFNGISYGIFNSTSGTLVIGVDDNILENNNITIFSNLCVSDYSYGIFNQDGTFNFYDGKLIGKFGTNGLVSSIPTGSMLSLKNNFDMQTVTLSGELPIAQIADKTYMSLQEAFDSVEDNKQEKTVITLLRDAIFTNKDDIPTIEENKNIFLDMNGYKIISGKENVIINNGNVEIGNTKSISNISMSNVVANGKYYFEEDENGALISNNQGIDSSVANSYIEIDLTNYEGLINVSINAEISSCNTGNYVEYGYATITETVDAPTYNQKEGQFMIISGKTYGNYDIDINGGKIYYLHFGYRKTNYIDVDSDQLKINSIELKASPEIINPNKTCISNYGDLTISDNVKLSIYEDENGTIHNEGNLTIDNGSINAIGNTTVYGIYNAQKGNVTINTASINSLYTSTSSGNAYGIYNISTGNVIINNVNIFVSSKEIGGKLHTGGNSCGIYNNAGNIIINNANIDVKVATRTMSKLSAYGINNNKGTLTINNGKIKTYIYSASNYSSNSHGINNRGNLLINNVDIEATSSSETNNTSGIYNSGDAIIKNGIITASGSTNYNVYGIYNSSKAVCTLGNNDGIVNVNYPEIATSKGTNSYGIYNASGTFNFYDGKITAGTATITGNVTEVAPGYEIKKTLTDEMITDILVLSSTDNTVCVLNSINYSSLQDALDACTGTENYTISLTNVCELTEPLTIPEGKNITLSINGFDIYYDGSDSMIINNGTLTIKDTNTVSSGNLSNTIGNVIENNGTLIIGDNDGNVTSRSPHITGTDIAITNNGTIEFYDGTITGITPISGNDIKTIPEDYNLVETTENNLKTLSLIGIAPEVTYTTENVSGGTKITVTATDTNLSMIINPDDSEVTGSDTEIVSEYIATSSGMYTFKAIDKNNNVTTINVAV